MCAHWKAAEPLSRYIPPAFLAAQAMSLALVRVCRVSRESGGTIPKTVADAAPCQAEKGDRPPWVPSQPCGTEQSDKTADFGCPSE